MKEARLAAGMSQRELSFPGCTAVYICRIEKGDRVPSLQLLRELARRLGVDENYLATGAARVDGADGLVEADVALRLDQLELAEQLYTQTLEASIDRVNRGRALGGLGEIDLHAGRLDEAIELLEESRRLLGDGLAGYPGIVDALARAYGLASEFEQAIALLEHSLQLARDHGDDRAEARFLVLLADVLIDNGNLASARELLGHSLAKSEESTDPILQARLYWSQSRLHSADANAEAASRYARMALAAIELTENVSYAARAHQLLAHVELEQGNAEEALDLVDRGQALAARAGGADADGYFKIARAQALAQLGREEEAIAGAMELAGAFESRPDLAGRAYAVAADVYAQTGDRARALELYELSGELMAERDPAFIRELYGKMAELLEAEGRKDDALELLKRAMGLKQQARR
ncbi:MAG TPA: tetratricopeptide repeat protein [Gaiellaceae bacterium]|nr:tetratricopeptide repeat protein [Gaiellaceae bacterium]